MNRVMLSVFLVASLAGCKGSKDTPSTGSSPVKAEATAQPAKACAAAAQGLLALCPSCALDVNAVPGGFDCSAAETDVTRLGVLVENVDAKVPLKSQLVGTTWANLASRTKVTFAAAKKGCPECFDRPPPSAAVGARCKACFDRPYEGKFTVSYPDGTRRVVGAYAKGKLDGPVSSFHPNGIKADEKSYRAGVLHGPFTEWDEGSRKTRAGVYDEGALHGDHKRFSGMRVVEQGAYQYGVRTGRWMKWYPSGKKRSQRAYETQCDGRNCTTKRHGLFITWDEAGKIASLTQYARGERVEVNREALKKGR